MSSRASLSGGIIKLSDLLTQLEEMRGPNAYKITENDIEIAVKKMKVLGSGFNVFSIGSTKMVQSVPHELSTDHLTVLTLVQNEDHITKSLIKQKLNWEDNRIDAIINIMLQSGIIWIDSVEGQEDQYWFMTF
eukprot:TRINITY_DN1924_c0_g1_i1.p1 TRINITY_DN1924_c0_g1~~TRINITY_DN1924_c0_g1_i1.p1  ORF type:complete len:133 (-),score=28.36 TRINITY_DN1924_c0_g1_i1:72-470(-)